MDDRLRAARLKMSPREYEAHPDEIREMLWAQHRAMVSEDPWDGYYRPHGSSRDRVPPTIGSLPAFSVWSFVGIALAVFLASLESGVTAAITVSLLLLVVSSLIALRGRQAIRDAIRTMLHPPCRPAARRQ